MADTIAVNGGCCCGELAVMGEVSSNKIMACDRTDCQKFSGAPFRVVTVIAADDMKISGTVTEFLKIAKNGNEGLQGFCGKCGRHLYATDSAKTLFMIRNGCLD
ncbi:MAG: GFA family protein [Candidatus Puniceispirillaceae bacterium]